MTDDPAAEPGHVSPAVSVLVIDDEAALVRMLKFVLKDHGFSVQTATSGKQALELYGREHRSIDVVILNVHMPDMDGPATLAALREVAADVRCIFMAGSSGDYTAEQLLEMGAARVVEKPFTSIGDLMRVIREVAATDPG